MTTRRTGIQSVAALRGRSVSIGAPGSATGILARRVLAAAGLDIDRDLRSRRSLGASEANTAILRGEADTSFKVAGLPSPAIADLAARPGTVLVLVDHVELHGVLAQRHGPVYVPDLVPAGTCRGQESGNRQISALTMLAVHAAAPGALVELLLGVAWGSRADWTAAHPQIQDFTLARQTAAAAVIPWHPAAEAFWLAHGARHA